MNSQRYFYRHDPIQTLRKKWASGALYARRCITQDPNWYPHAQLDRALKSLAAGQALFQLSMWKDEVAALESLKFLCLTPVEGQVVLLQRIPVELPIFARMKKDQDQYHAGAWLFWGIEPLSEDPEVYTPKVPYRNIEVLTLDGRWVPYCDAPCLPGAINCPGWKTVKVSGNGGVSKSVLLRSVTLDAGYDVAAFQPNDGLAMVNRGLDDRTYRDGVVGAAVAQFPWLRERGCLWHIQEFSWGSRVEKLELTRMPHPLRLIRSIAHRIGLQDIFAPRVVGNVRRDVDPRCQRELCRHVQLVDIEKGDKRWCYSIESLSGWLACAKQNASL